jgi:hypothetical protein
LLLEGDLAKPHKVLLQDSGTVFMWEVPGELRYVLTSPAICTCKQMRERVGSSIQVYSRCSS